MKKPKDSMDKGGNTRRDVRMMDKLTPEQERLLPIYKEEGIALGLATDKGLTLEEVTPLIEEAYRNADLTPPGKVVYVDSPVQLLTACFKLLKKTEREPTSEELKALWCELDIFCGSQEAYWMYFYKFFKDACGVPGLEKLDPLMNLAKSVGWCVFYDEAAVVSRLPIQIHVAHGRLHNQLGPAVLYKDGYSVYCMNGVRFEKSKIKFILLPANDISPEEILGIQNVEQRAEVIKKVGVKNLFDKLKPTKLDSLVKKAYNTSYELYSVVLGNYSPRIYLKMINPSTGETHLEAVHPDCKTVSEALQWRKTGIVSDKYIFPRFLT